MKKFGGLIVLFLLTFMLVSPALAADLFEKDLKYGMVNNNDVKQLQDFLYNEGFYKGPVTGNFYSLTQAAVKKYQAANKIKPVNGILNKVTRDKVNTVLLAKENAPEDTNDEITYTDEDEAVRLAWVQSNLQRVDQPVSIINNYYSTPSLVTSPNSFTNPIPPVAEKLPISKEQCLVNVQNQYNIELAKAIASNQQEDNRMFSELKTSQDRIDYFKNLFEKIDCKTVLLQSKESPIMLAEWKISSSTFNFSIEKQQEFFTNLHSCTNYNQNLIDEQIKFDRMHNYLEQWKKTQLEATKTLFDSKKNEC